MKRIQAVFPALILLVAAASGASAQKKFYVPAQVPVNIKPSLQDGQLLSVGFNRLGVVADWEDNFFSSVSEPVGELKATATNLAIGKIRNRSEAYSEEWTFIAGKLSLEEETKRYTSTIIGKPVDLDADGSGFDVGLRYLGGYSLKKTELENGRTIDWNLALGLHAAYFYLNTTYKAASTDGKDVNEYDSWQNGVFLRPVVAFQPIVELGAGVSLVPYVGVNTMVILSHEAWEDLRYVRKGVNGGLSDDAELSASSRGIEAIAGFDLGLISPIKREHKMTIGGAFSKLFGGSSGDFTELHLAYAVPWGEREGGR